MTTPFPKDIQDCMRECILSVFWPKADIVGFFKSAGCTKEHLAEVDRTDHKQLSRAKIVDLVFAALNDRPDTGLGPFRRMLKLLCDWNQFSPYWFDVKGKLDRARAERLLNHLRQLQEIRDAAVRERQQQFQARESMQQITAEKESLGKRYANLWAGKDAFGQPVTHQQRGFLFQDWLLDACRLHGVEVTTPFRIVGEQIDGALKFDGENYIIEAKWQAANISNEALYQFAFKVQGKMHGRGIFVAINGFSEDAVTALVRGKVLNMVLVDGEDCSLLAEGIISFRDLLDTKVRAAQTSGRIYVHPVSGKDKIQLSA